MIESDMGQYALPPSEQDPIHLDTPTAEHDGAASPIDPDIAEHLGHDAIQQADIELIDIPEQANARTAEVEAEALIPTPRRMRPKKITPEVSKDYPKLFVSLPSDEERRVTVDEERQLIALIMDGGDRSRVAQDAFSRLFRSHAPGIVKQDIFKKMPLYDIENILSGTAEKAWNAIRQGRLPLRSDRSRESTLAWFRRVAHNHVIDEGRKAKLRPYDTQALPLHEVVTDQTRIFSNPISLERRVMAKVTLEILFDEFVKLRQKRDEESPNDIVDPYEILNLFQLAADGYTVSQIAQKTGLEPGTVKSRLFYAKKDMKKIAKQLALEENTI